MRTIPHSSTVAMSNSAIEKKRQGIRVYNFAGGDPALKNHPLILERAIKSMEKGEFQYPPILGLPLLRELAMHWMQEEYGASFDTVVVTPGGKFALFSAIATLVQEGSEVLIAAPYWVSYPSIVTMGGAIPKIVATKRENGWKITAKELEKSITDKTTLFIFNNACNPTGTLYTREEIAALLKIAKKYEILVLSDEVYSGLTYDPYTFISCGSFLEYKEQVVVIQSASKNFAMTGWRVGFVFGQEKHITAIGHFQGQTTNGVSRLNQMAVVGALENRKEVSAYVRRNMQERRDLFCEIYNSLFENTLEEVPAGLYVFTSLCSSESDELFCQQLIDKANIATVPGTAFGAPGYVRFSFSSEKEEIEQGLYALKNAKECVKRWII